MKYWGITINDGYIEHYGVRGMRWRKGKKKKPNPGVKKGSGKYHQWDQYTGPDTYNDLSNSRQMDWFRRANGYGYIYGDYGNKGEGNGNSHILNMKLRTAVGEMGPAGYNRSYNSERWRSSTNFGRVASRNVSQLKKTVTNSGSSFISAISSAVGSIKKKTKSNKSFGQKKK